MIRTKRYKNILASRMAAVLPAVALQIFWIYLLIKRLWKWAAIINGTLMALAMLFVLYLISKREEPSYKIMWLLIILVFPVPGAALYLSFGNRGSGRPLKRLLEKTRTGSGAPPDSGISAYEITDNIRIAQIFALLEKQTGFSVYENRSAVYYPCGEKMFEDYLFELRNAERYIYLEYFIIEYGVMWEAVLDILAKKAEEGLDVRVIYDDLGCIATLPTKYYNYLRKNKIKCIKFNPFILAVTGRLNNRDHRKITVIDGKTAFSGGINLADEYINEKEKYGYWKDTAFKVTGRAAESYAYMFAEFWNAFADSGSGLISIDFSAARNATDETDGYVLSYYDSPVGKYSASCCLYSEILSRCEKYAWFYTPYLMLGDELLNAFEHAAERGADIRVIMPGIPDKKMIYRISRSYYLPLLEAGVRIFEYEPGFVHAKCCVSDDIIGTAGSVNLDYRSLFLHFECNSLFYEASLLDSLKEDYENTLKQCREITLDSVGRNFFYRVINGILRLFAPLC